MEDLDLTENVTVYHVSEYIQSSHGRQPTAIDQPVLIRVSRRLSKNSFLYNLLHRRGRLVL